MCIDPRNSEAPGRRLNVVASTERRVAEDHVVIVYLLEEGFVLFRSQIAGSQHNTLLTPESTGALREIFGMMPAAW
jgi:hypothetical protein